MNTLKKITQPGVKASLRVVMVSIVSLGLASVAQAMDCEDENQSHQGNKKVWSEGLKKNASEKSDSDAGDDVELSSMLEKNFKKLKVKSPDAEEEKKSTKPTLGPKNEPNEEYKKSDKNTEKKLGKRTIENSQEYSHQEILQRKKKYSPEDQQNS